MAAHTPLQTYMFEPESEPENEEAPEEVREPKIEQDISECNVMCFCHH